MRSAIAAVALSAWVSSALASSLSLPINLNLDLKSQLLSLKLDPNVDPDLDLTDLVNLGKINILSSPVDTSSTQSGDDNTVIRGGRKMRARRTLLGLDLSPDADDSNINLSDLIDLSKLNVLSAPVDTHSEQPGDGNTVIRGGRKARSLLNLDLSPNVSPKVSLNDLLNLSTINVLSSPVDTSSSQSGDGNCVTRGGRKRGWTESSGASSGGLLNVNLQALLSGGSHKLDLSNLLGLNKVLSGSHTTTNTGTTTDSTTKDTTVKAADVDASPSISPTISASNLLNLDKINVLSAPVDTHSEQSGDNNTVDRSGKKAKRTLSLGHLLSNLGLSNDQLSKLNLNLANADASGATVSPDVSASDLLNLSKLNILSAPVDTHSEQSGDGNTVVRGGRRAKRTLGLANLLSSLGVSDSDISSLNLGDIDVSPDVSPDVDLSDLLDLSTINVLSAPVDTHSEQSGTGNTVVRGGRKVKRTVGVGSLLSSLGVSDSEISSLNLGDASVSPDVSPDVSLSDLLDLSTINVLSAPVDTHSEQSGDNNTVVRGGRRMVKIRKTKK